MPLKYVRIAAALTFAVIGTWVLAAAFLGKGFSF
jgi:hypothetical protein